jgi:hypothetical protein
MPRPPRTIEKHTTQWGNVPSLNNDYLLDDESSQSITHQKSENQIRPSSDESSHSTKK